MTGATITDVKTIAIGDMGPPPSRGWCTTPLDVVRGGRAGPASLPPIRYLVVQLETDAGVTGYGNVGVNPGAAASLIQHQLRQLVAGRDLFDSNRLWETMYRATIPYGRKGIAVEAISGIDLAIWDAKGKLLGQPVYNLIGGRMRERIPVYASRLYYSDDEDEVVAEAESYLAQGFRAMKARLGYGPADGTGGMRKNLRHFRAIREAVGPDVDLMADVYMGWDVRYARRMLPALAEMGLVWLEEPVIPDDIDGYRAIKAAANQLGVLVAGGEHEFTRWGARQLIESGAVDVLQPDLNRVGGITEAMRIWALAEAHDLQVTPHAGQVHNYHLVISHLNSPISEYFPKPPGNPDGNELFWRVWRGEPEVEDGHVTLSDAPGLGIEPDWDVVERFGLGGGGGASL